MAEERRRPAPPEISPYVLTALLAGFGLWCFYDGWLTTDPAMQEHLLFNRILSLILLPWAAIDFVRMRKREKRAAAAKDGPGAGGPA